MKFISGIAVGVVLTAGGFTVLAQNERAMHPHISSAISALREAVV